MRSSAIIRIIIYSILIFILLCVLLTGLGIGMYMINFDDKSSGYTVVEGNEAVSLPTDFENIDIDWAAGSIDIQTSNTENISFGESGNFSEDQQMVWKLTDNTLRITYSKPGFQVGFLSSPSKNLTITIPEAWNCNELSISVASADISIANVTVNEVDIETASGECEFVDCSIEELNVDTASGSIQYSGVLNSLDCDAASGSFTGKFTNTPRSLEMDSASGDLNITLPQGAGFRVDMESLSGDLRSDFEGFYDKDAFISGDGRCKINFDGASGDIVINEAN